MKNLSKLFTLLLVVVMIGSFTTSIYSQEEVKTISGVVKAIDVKSNSITVNEDGTQIDLNFTVTEETVIKKGDKKIELADLQKNDAVDIKFIDSSKVKFIIVKIK